MYLESNGKINLYAVVLYKGLPVWFESRTASYLLPGEILSYKGSTVIVRNKCNNEVSYLLLLGVLYTLGLFVLPIS